MTTRQEKLVELIDTKYEGKQVRFAEASGLAGAIVSQYVRGKAVITPKAAGKIEAKTGFAGWFDGATEEVALIEKTEAVATEKAPKVAKAPKAEKVAKVKKVKESKVVAVSVTASADDSGLLDGLLSKAKLIGDPVDVLTKYLGITSLVTRMAVVEARLKELEVTK